jgi:hypothetical protein
MLLEEPTTLMDVALMGRAAVVALSLAGARLEAATGIPANETPAMVGSAPVCAVKRQVTFCPAVESRLRRPVSAYARLACTISYPTSKINMQHEGRVRRRLRSSSRG